MRLFDRVERVVEPDRLPIPGRLTTEELDAAVALQLEQLAEQGFGKIRPTVLSRVAEIVSTVRREEATTAPDACRDNATDLRQVA